MSAIMMRGAQSDSNGSYGFSVGSVVLLSEFGKLILSFLLQWIATRHEETDFLPSLKPLFHNSEDLWLYFLVAALYFLQNNFVYVAFELMDSATYLVLNNMKIITTAIVSVVFLKRSMNKLEWSVAILISCGMMISALPDCGGDSSGETFRIGLAAFSVSVVMAILSAAAGATNDYVMKKGVKTETIHIQNMRLYFFGVMFNFVGLARDFSSIFGDGLFTGYNWQAWMLVLLGSCAGLVVSAVMKYASVLIKTYSMAVSMLVTAFASSLLFSAPLTLPLILGGVVVSTSLYLHAMPGAVLVPDHRDS